MATWTVRESGGDYTTLASALSNASTGAGDTISIEGTWTVDDTAPATVADNDITIQTDASSRHPGYVTASPTYYRLRCATNGSHCITVNNTGCTIIGLEIKQASTGMSDEGIRIGGAITVTIRKCLIYTLAATTSQDGIYHGNVAPTVTVQNSSIYGFSRAGIHAQNFSGGSGTSTWNVNSCSIWNCGNERNTPNLSPGGVGVVMDDITINVNVFNSVVVENTVGESTADFNEEVLAGATGTLTWNIDYSIDSDGSIAARDAGAVGSLGNRTATDNASPGAGDWVVFENITTTPYDIRLKTSAENDAENMHSSTTGAGLTIPSDDIAGTTRSAPYDCGSFQFAGAAATSLLYNPRRAFQPLLVR